MTITNTIRRAWRVRYTNGVTLYKVTYDVHVDGTVTGTSTPAATIEPLEGIEYAETVDAPFAVSTAELAELNGVKLELEEDAYPAAVCGNCLDGCDGTDVGVEYDLDSGRRLCALCRSVPDLESARRMASDIAWSYDRWVGVLEFYLGDALRYAVTVPAVAPTPAEMTARRIVAWFPGR